MKRVKQPLRTPSDRSGNGNPPNDPPSYGGGDSGDREDLKRRYISNMGSYAPEDAQRTFIIERTQIDDPNHYLYLSNEDLEKGANASYENLQEDGHKKALRPGGKWHALWYHIP